RLSDVAQFALSVGGNPHELPNFFLGQVIWSDPGPLYYPMALAFRLGPIATAGLLILLVRSLRSPRHASASAWIAIYIALFVAVMMIGAKKFDRYMLPVLPALDLLAGLGLWYALTGLKRPRPVAAGVAALLPLQCALLLAAYPFPL